MKYQLTPKIAQFDKDGFVIAEGWALIYNTDTRTGEFINATYEYVAEGYTKNHIEWVEVPHTQIVI